MSSSKPIELAYCPAGCVSSKEWSTVEFPGVSEADMTKLLDVCSVASYGHMGKNVVDKTYRSAFKLEPDNFLTSFQICATPILQEIQLIVPTAVGLKAELSKLNVYACDGFFKAHVDTPRSDKMFGSLVVCLPTQFTGGELIVRHNEQEIQYDWSSTALDASNTLHWAALFSDAEHKVLPVSEGYRVTFTYNLSYHSNASDITFDVKTNSFYELLQAALSNLEFMRVAACLASVFDTQWADLLTPINTKPDKAAAVKELDRIAPCDKFVNLSAQIKVLGEVGIEDVETVNKFWIHFHQIFLLLLKGANYIVAESAKPLGLPVCVKPFLSNNRADENGLFTVYVIERLL